MKNKKNKTLILIIVVTLLVVAVGMTFAYFSAQVGSGTSVDVTVTSKTTDHLTFNKGNDITIHATQANFYNGAGNRTGSTNVSATLVANNATNSATATYNVSLNITANDFVYETCEPDEPDEPDPGNYNALSNINNDASFSDLVNYPKSNSNVEKMTNNNCPRAELILTITDPNNNPVTSLPGLTYTTSGGVSGFDITTKTGKIDIAKDYTITSTGTKTDTWNITVTFVNLDTDQEYNTGKTFTASASIFNPTYVYWNDGYGYRNLDPYNVTTQYYNLPNISPINYSSLNSLLQNNNGSSNAVYIKSTLTDPPVNADNTDHYYLIGKGEDVTGAIANSDAYSLALDLYYCCVEEGTYCDYNITFSEVEDTTKNDGSGTETITINNQSYSIYYDVTLHEYTTDIEEFAQDILEALIAAGIVGVSNARYASENQVCLYYNSHEFCMDANYWDTDATTTLAKLQSDMQSIYGNGVSCQVESGASESGASACTINNIVCGAFPGGSACYTSTNVCDVHAYSGTCTIGSYTNNNSGSGR